MKACTVTCNEILLTCYFSKLIIAFHEVVPKFLKRSMHFNIPSSGHLATTVCMDLQHTLKLNYDRIRHRYALFVSRLCECLEEKGVAVRYLCTLVLRLLPSEPDEICDPLQQVRIKLKEAKTINEIIDLVGDNCASYLHCNIFQSILEKYCRDMMDEDEDLKYSEHLKIYVNQLKVSEYVTINPDLEQYASNSKEIVLKVDIPMTSKLKKIMEIQSALARILGVLPSDLKLLAIKDGCVTVTFTLPSKMLGKFRKIPKARIEELKSLSVRWLKCGDGQCTHYHHFDEGLTRIDNSSKKWSEGGSSPPKCSTSPTNDFPRKVLHSPPNEHNAPSSLLPKTELQPIQR